MTLRPKATPSSYSPAIANEQTAAVSTGLLVERDQKTCNGQSHLQRLARRKVRDVWWNGATNDLRIFFIFAVGTYHEELPVVWTGGIKYNRSMWSSFHRPVYRALHRHVTRHAHYFCGHAIRIEHCWSRLFASTVCDRALS